MSPDRSHIASEFARAIDEWEESDPGIYFDDHELNDDGSGNEEECD